MSGEERREKEGGRDREEEMREEGVELRNLSDETVKRDMKKMKIAEARRKKKKRRGGSEGREKQVVVWDQAASDQMTRYRVCCTRSLYAYSNSSKHKHCRSAVGGGHNSKHSIEDHVHEASD